MENTENNRRQFLKKLTIVGLAGMALPAISGAFSSDEKGPFSEGLMDDFMSLPMLGYGYDALEPHIDTLTMQIHHSRHHQAYVTNLNKAMKENNIDADLDQLIKNVSKYPMVVRNNGGGHWNHTFFWKLMKPNGGGEPTGKIAEAINNSFESFQKFQSLLNDAALKRFGSGWAWLIKTPEGKLAICSTPNQDNPLMDIAEVKGIPLLGIDVWEHAYYLHYQNKRADYLNAWWNVVNWNDVASRL
jgi:Fe-Mn family superoxide dismutase